LFNISEIVSNERLGNICHISTGKLDANAMEDNGKYPFFTCAEEVYKINHYDFDDEALLISGNGVNVGYIHYYKGKFNAYQRTYILKSFQENIRYVQLFLETYLHKRIELEKNTGNTPYIVLGTLSDMFIRFPKREKQEQIVRTVSAIKLKLETEKQYLQNLKHQKYYLLSTLFI